MGQITKPSYFRPGTVHEDDGTVHARPLSEGEGGEEWVLVNGFVNESSLKFCWLSMYPYYR